MDYYVDKFEHLILKKKAPVSEKRTGAYNSIPWSPCPSREGFERIDKKLAGLLAHGITAPVPSHPISDSDIRLIAIYSCGAASASNGIPFSSRDLKRDTNLWREKEQELQTQYTGQGSHCQEKCLNLRIFLTTEMIKMESRPMCMQAYSPFQPL